MNKELLRLKIDGYLKDGSVYEDRDFSILVPYYIAKARHNLLTANLLNKMWAVKSKRNIAHYKAEKDISRKDAARIIEQANKFVDRLHQLILNIQG